MSTEIFWPARIVALIADLAVDLRDRGPILADLAARLDAEPGRVLEGWRAAAGNATWSTSVYQSAWGVWISALAKDSGVSLENYLSGLASWTRECARRGYEYEDLISQFAWLRRSSLPVIMEGYSPGPELTLVLPALDALERAIRTVVAAVMLDHAHALLRETARLRSAGLLARGNAHAMNNWLSNIVNRAELARRQVADETILKELVAIQTAGTTAAENVHRLQEYGAAPGPETASNFDLRQVVEEAVSLSRYRWRDDAEANGVVIDLHRDLADLPSVRGRPRQLRDAIVELILNAAEAMPEGGFITVRTEQQGEQAVVSVIDIGTGIDGDLASRLPKPFVTTKGPGHVGLGLALAETAAEAHGGRLEISSTPGQGTAVRMSVPFAPELPGEEGTAIPEVHRTLTILIIDDDAGIRDLAARSLDLRGHRALTAASGREGIDLFETRGPVDAVLCDLGMPEQNGFDVAAQIKANSPDTLFILMTGWASELDREGMRRRSIDYVVNKPFDVDEIFHLIASGRPAVP